MITQTQISSNTNSSHSTSNIASNNSLPNVSRETIQRASLLKLGKTKHEFVMLMGRLWEQYGSIHVGLAKLSEMLIERIDKQLTERQMKRLSEWFIETLGRRWRHGHYGKYHYALSDIGLAYYHIGRYRIEKMSPVISKNVTCINTKNIYEEKQIKINAPPVDKPPEQKPTSKTVDIDLVNQAIIHAVVTEAGVRKQTAVKWANMFGIKAIEDIFKRSKLYSPANLGGYMHRIIQLTPPVRIDVERITKFEPVEVLTKDEQKDHLARLNAVRQMNRLCTGAI